MAASIRSQPSPLRMHALAWLSVLLCVLATGCKSYRHVPLDTIASEVEPGDELRIVLADGSKYQLKVYLIDHETITGSTATVPLKDIVFLEKRRIDVLRSLGMGFATTTATVFVLTLAVGVVTILLLIVTP